MVVKQIETSDISELDTKNKILEAALNLFALHGFEGTTVRMIAELADVNVASVNYHFKSKENLRQEVVNYIVSDYKDRISSITDASSAADFAVKLFHLNSADSAKCLNRFKLILNAEADTLPVDKDPYPKCYEQFAPFLDKELKQSVPESERIWFVNVVFCYINHTAIMSSTAVGKKSMDKFFPNKRASIPVFITQLVETLIRDLNRRYSK